MCPDVDSASVLTRARSLPGAPRQRATRDARRAWRPSRARALAARPALAFEARERARLRAHFREVLAELAARDVSHLPAPQRARRARLVAELARYAARGRFPKNFHFPDRKMPYFIDPLGTRCAMAHLIETSGGASLVARVAATANNAFIRELAGDLELAAWLDWAGLTAAEAARIQPSYCSSIALHCFCSGAAPAKTVIEAVVVEEIDVDHFRAVITHVHGDTSTVKLCGELTVHGKLLLGDAFLSNPEGTLRFRLNGDGTVATACNSADVPPLKKEDAIAALLAKGDFGACEAHLVAIDPQWQADSCWGLGEGSSGSGAGAGGSGAGASGSGAGPGGVDLGPCGGEGGGGEGGAAGTTTTGTVGSGGDGGAGGEGGSGGAGDGAHGTDVAVSAGCAVGVLPVGGGFTPWLLAAGVLWARRRIVTTRRRSPRA